MHDHKILMIGQQVEAYKNKNGPQKRFKFKTKIKITRRLNSSLIFSTFIIIIWLKYEFSSYIRREGFKFVLQLRNTLVIKNLKRLIF